MAAFPLAPTPCAPTDIGSGQGVPAFPRDLARGACARDGTATQRVQLLRRRQRAALRQARAAGELCVLHPFDSVVLARALELVRASSIRGRDAIHAATALLAGVPTMLSSDAEFDGVPGMVRVQLYLLP